ncbi:hypothetical protein [Streptomyces sp. MUM 178J]|nr:hypothetical protein [Streptomyces sp. MUM 178J]WRQ79353.1 hypothetical protein I3F59_008220 [Streptomyces sp. MUM 178J]
MTAQRSMGSNYRAGSLRVAFGVDVSDPDNPKQIWKLAGFDAFA